METIEIKDDDINTEDIMCQIRENIRKRKESGIYNKEMEILIDKPLKTCNAITSEDDLQQNLDYINSNWDIHTEYNISSHRPIIGRLLVWGRKLVYDEVKRYVDLITGKQSEFNACIVRILNNSNKNIDAKINNAIIAANKDMDSDEQKYDISNYFVFEEKFRGSTEEIRQRQSIFLEYFKNCKNVLDIGCGRGELLSLLKENSIGAKGIDINEDMVLYCQKNDLNVEKVDALSYLELLNNKSLEGVFLGQVIEHLQSRQLINIIKLCYDKMKYGTYFVAETINPLCLSVFATSFYMDLSHVKPIHPDTIKFLLESVGFRDIHFKFFSPFPETAKLNKSDINDNMSNDEKVHMEIMNSNIDKLNSLLYGYQDYAIIAKK